MRFTMALALLALCFPFFANAEIITLGFLQSDTEGETITDTQTGREYLRFDQYFATYESLMVELSDTGSLFGWSVATSAETADFINSLFQGKPNCTKAFGTYDNNCYRDGSTSLGIEGWTQGVLGDNWNDSRDRFAYLSTSPNGEKLIGSAIIFASGVIRDYDSWGKISNFNTYSLLSASSTMNMLLYKDPVQPIEKLNQSTFLVNAPKTIAFFIFGLYWLQRLPRQNRNSGGIGRF